MAVRGGDVEVVGDHAQVLVVHQRMGHRFRRGADIDEQRGAVRDLAGDALRDAGFLFRPHHLAIVISSVDRAGRQRRAAVVTLDLVLVGQVIQIAANRLRADVKMFHQLFRADVTLQAHQLDNCVMTLCLLHDNP